FVPNDVDPTGHWGLHLPKFVKKAAHYVASHTEHFGVAIGHEFEELGHDALKLIDRLEYGMKFDGGATWDFWEGTVGLAVTGWAGITYDVKATKVGWSWEGKFDIMKPKRLGWIPKLTDAIPNCPTGCCKNRVEAEASIPLWAKEVQRGANTLP